MLLFAVMIGPTTGGGFKVAPDADPTDGRMDVLLMRRMARAQSAGRHAQSQGGQAHQDARGAHAAQ
jgi:diacylglycerol kinase family enzyme